MTRHDEINAGSGCSVAVVIPCYKVLDSISEVVHGVLDFADLIVVVDDHCPEKSGQYVEKMFLNDKVKVIYHDVNTGVGGAVLSGYQFAFDYGVDVIVKMDGDGQMDPLYLNDLVDPILNGTADYTKGNRFFDVESTAQMPLVRLIGNVGLSFFTKMSSGYWNIFDPTNGYTAISASVARNLPFEKIQKGYFFESDVLFRLNILRAVVMDVSMAAKYGNEISNLNILNEFAKFLFLNLKNFGKRIIYSYFIRDFNYASIELLFGFFLSIFGVLFGLVSWVEASQQEAIATAGTVMLASLPIILGTQLLLGFLNYDMRNIPITVLHK